jgi:hypothetical protein
VVAHRLGEEAEILAQLELHAREPAVVAFVQLSATDELRGTTVCLDWILEALVEDAEGDDLQRRRTTPSAGRSCRCALR